VSTAEQNLGLAARLRAAREAQGLDTESLGRELKIPQAVLESIERGEWSRLGAPVFIRHQVGRYSRRLGVEADLDDLASHVRSPELRSHVPVSRAGWFADFSARNAAYVGGSLLVLPLVYLALTFTPSGPSQVRALDPEPQTVTVAPPALLPEPTSDVAQIPATAAPPVSEPIATGEADAAALPPVSPDTTPALPAASPKTVVASLTGGAMAPPSQALELRFTADSWIEVFGRNGGATEQFLARAGESRSFNAAEVGRVTVGNVEGTEVLLNGSRMNLDAVRSANVARFALSSDGSIEAVAR
jgi:cytoskeleton protein RodZ